jgi:hypothetical protein
VLPGPPWPSQRNWTWRSTPSGIISRREMLGNSRRIRRLDPLVSIARHPPPPLGLAPPPPRPRASGHPPPPLVGRVATATRARRRGWRGWLRHPRKPHRLWRSSTRRLWRPPTPKLARTMDFAQGRSRIFVHDATIEHIVCYNCSKSLHQ